LEGNIILHLAADQNYQEIINLLIDNRAEVGLIDKLSWLLLYCSARLGYRTATKFLIDRKVVVIIEDNHRYITRDIIKKAGSDRVIKAFNNKETGFIIYNNRMIQF
jgi:ankyrin repeat protein